MSDSRRGSRARPARAASAGPRVARGRPKRAPAATSGRTSGHGNCGASVAGAHISARAAQAMVAISCRCQLQGRRRIVGGRRGQTGARSCFVALAPRRTQCDSARRHGRRPGPATGRGWAWPRAPSASGPLRVLVRARGCGCLQAACGGARDSRTNGPAKRSQFARTMQFGSGRRCAPPPPGGAVGVVGAGRMRGPSCGAPEPALGPTSRPSVQLGAGQSHSQRRPARHDNNFCAPTLALSPDQPLVRTSRPQAQHSAGHSSDTQPDFTPDSAPQVRESSAAA